MNQEVNQDATQTHNNLSNHVSSTIDKGVTFTGVLSSEYVVNTLNRVANQLEDVLKQTETDFTSRPMYEQLILAGDPAPQIKDWYMIQLDIPKLELGNTSKRNREQSDTQDDDSINSFWLVYPFHLQTQTDNKKPNGSWGQTWEQFVSKIKKWLRVASTGTLRTTTTRVFRAGTIQLPLSCPLPERFLSTLIETPSEIDTTTALFYSVRNLMATIELPLQSLESAFFLKDDAEKVKQQSEQWLRKIKDEVKENENQSINLPDFTIRVVPVTSLLVNTGFYVRESK